VRFIALWNILESGVHVLALENNFMAHVKKQKAKKTKKTKTSFFYHV
jgi:hypothetical protein